MFVLHFRRRHLPQTVHMGKADCLTLLTVSWLQTPETFWLYPRQPPLPVQCKHSLIWMVKLNTTLFTSNNIIFLVRLYSSQCRVLAFSTTSLNLPLSWTRVFQFGTSNLRISFLTSSSQRIFVLSFGLFEMGFQACIALGTLVSCILSTWPYHPSLFALAKFIMFSCFISLSNSSLVFILQDPFS